MCLPSIAPKVPGADPGFVGSNVYAVGGEGTFKEKNTKLRHKIRYESDNLFR